jgi:hypothetical protein
VEINWNSVLQGATAGIAASLILGIGSLLRHRVKDSVFRWRLRRSLRLLSLGHTLDGLTTGIQNQLGQPFTVRHLVLVTDTADLRFDATDEVTSSFKGQLPKLPRKQLRALKKGLIKEIPIGTEVQFRSLKSWQSTPTREGFVTVEPYTSHRFLLPYQLLAEPERTPRGFRTTIEYEAWPQKRKILQITTTGSLDQVKKMLEHARIEISNGSLNTARARFGKPPIVVKNTPQATVGT